MIRRPVTSSNVSGVGWEASQDEEGDGTLEVEFRSGHVYRYQNVPFATYQALIGASSVGKSLNEMIVGRYSESRIK